MTTDSQGDIPTIGRMRVCGAILLNDHILMVQHRESDRTYWTLPGGGVEAGETAHQAVIREVEEETGLHTIVDRFLFEEPYAAGVCACYLLTMPVAQEASVGFDPEEADLAAEARMLQDVAWRPLASLHDDRQVTQVLQALGR